MADDELRYRIREIELGLREVREELASLRGWREAVSMRDDKMAAWVPVLVAIGAVIVSSIVSWLLVGAP